MLQTPRQDKREQLCFMGDILRLSTGKNLLSQIRQSGSFTILVKLMSLCLCFITLTWLMYHSDFIRCDSAHGVDFNILVKAHTPAQPKNDHYVLKSNRR